MRPASILALTLLGALVIWSETAAADIDNEASEGWNTWQIDEAGQLSERCCFTWRGVQSQNGCNLDGSHVAPGNKGGCASAPGRIQIYALIKDGEPAKILALSSQCPVTTVAPVNDLGAVSPADNVAWFRRVIEDARLGQDIREQALLGLVQSESDAGFDYIDSLLSRR